MNKKKDEIPNEPHDGTFMGMVQSHEREWGTTKYLERPSLADIFAAKVVAFWQKSSGDDRREFITLHEDTGDIENHLARLVLRSKLQQPDRRLVTVFEAQKRLRIKAFKILFVPEEEK